MEALEREIENGAAVHSEHESAHRSQSDLPPAGSLEWVAVDDHLSLATHPRPCYNP